MTMEALDRSPLTDGETAWPSADCCSPNNGECACSPMERALRGWSRGDGMMPAMTNAQRTICLDEIAHVEGRDRTEHEASADKDLACATLDAWVDYCRDKGLL